ncbi:MAG: alkaline phosphatase family protein [Akkermansiaceae bacterium]|nr:alkaline phosphatase family protein [Akkermansiaceae bacterium]
MKVHPLLASLYVCSVSLWAGPASSGTGPIRHTTLPNDNPDMTLSQFAFGACWKPSHSQKHWAPIMANQPQLWLWLGDNIYADTDDMAVMKNKYGQLGDTPGYRKLVDLCPVLATWDDHDFGKDDVGRDYRMREASQKVFLEFFNERPDSARHKRPGVYTSYYFGQADQRVQLILLDTRYFRSPLKRIEGKAPYPRMGKYTPDLTRDATMLGDEQWTWLEGELKKPARVRIIGSSIQFAAPHNGYETWANMPNEKQRMIDLIIKTRAEGVVFLSGDIHSSEFCVEEPQQCYPIFDHTSSSLNVPLGAAATHRRMGPAFGGANFGVVHIDWAKSDPVIRFSTKDTSNQTRIHHSIPLSKLTFAEENLIWTTTPDSFAGAWQTFYGPLTLAKEGEGKWTGTCADRTLTLNEGQFGLVGTWRGEKQHGRVTFTLTRDGKFLNGAYSYENLPLQLDWAGWKADWEKHFKRDDYYQRKKKK